MDLLGKLQDITERTIIQKEHGIFSRVAQGNIRLITNGKTP